MEDEGWIAELRGLAAQNLDIVEIVDSMRMRHVGVGWLWARRSVRCRVVVSRSGMPAPGRRLRLRSLHLLAVMKSRLRVLCTVSLVALWC